MSLYDRNTASGDDDLLPAVQPKRLGRLGRELTRLHAGSETRALVMASDDVGLVRKSGRIKERDLQVSFSGFEKMKPLFLYDASVMLNDDVSRRRRRKVNFTSVVLNLGSRVPLGVPNANLRGPKRKSGISTNFPQYNNMKSIRY